MDISARVTHAAHPTALRRNGTPATLCSTTTAAPAIVELALATCKRCHTAADRQRQALRARIDARLVELAHREAAASAVADFDLADHVSSVHIRFWRRYGSPSFGTFGGVEVYVDAYGAEFDRLCALHEAAIAS
jgi:hypothetical protein